MIIYSYEIQRRRSWAQLRPEAIYEAIEAVPVIVAASGYDLIEPNGIRVDLYTDDPIPSLSLGSEYSTRRTGTRDSQ